MKFKFFYKGKILLILSLINISSVLACTGIQIKSQDGFYINGRSVEFGIPLNIGAIVIPRNYSFQGTLPDGSSGMPYRSKYAVVGGTMFGEQAVSDGVNESGLSVGAFYFPGFAVYSSVTSQNKSHALSPTQFPNWLLTQFANVEEVKAGLKNAMIVATTPKGWPVLPPFHYVVYDKTGKSIVIEPIKGRLKVYDNPIGVLTNSPTFDWHLTNLANYTNLSPINAVPVKVNGLELKQFGEGSGMRGLPGDFTPPSRFVRAAFFSVTALPSKDIETTILQAFHILNQFDIPAGAVRNIEQKHMAPEITLAITVKDPNHQKYYFKTYENQNIRVIDLNKFNLNAQKIVSIDMSAPQTIEDISSKGH